MSTKLALVALLVSALIYLALRAAPKDPEPARSRALAPVLDARTVEVATLRAPSTSAARQTPNEASPSTSVLESAGPATTRGELWLVGELIGLQGLDPTQTEICVEAHERTLRARALADGTYAIDVNPLDPSSLDAALLVIHARHPAWRRTRTEARIDDELRDRIARGYTELNVDLDLSPRTAVVGRVAEGRPEVALVRDGVVAASSEGSDEDECPGTFALYPAESGAYELLVRVPGRLTLRLAVEVAPREIRDVGTLVLAEEGVTIEGNLVRTEFLLGGVSLTATRADLAEEDEDTWGGAGLRTGRVRTSSSDVRADGTFRITGLEPGAYVLSLEDRRFGDRTQLAYPERTVLAPASGVEFGRELGLVRFRARGAESTAPATLLFSHSSDPEQNVHHAFGRLQLREARPIEVLVDRRSEFSATVQTEIARAPWRQIPAGRPVLFEVDFELLSEPSPRFGALELAWQWPADLSLPRTVRAYWQRDDDSANVEADARSDGCRFERLQPGRYRVVVVPRSAVFSEPLPSFAGTRAIEVEIEAGRTTHADVEWCLGGRARFMPEGTPREALEGLDAEVRDAVGARCPVTFVRREDGADGARSSSAQLALRVPSELEPNLAPGAYTLIVFDEGRELAAVPFTIVAGECVEVPVALPE